MKPFGRLDTPAKGPAAVGSVRRATDISKVHEVAVSLSREELQLSLGCSPSLLVGGARQPEVSTRPKRLNEDTKVLVVAGEHWIWSSASDDDGLQTRQPSEEQAILGYMNTEDVEEKDFIHLHMLWHMDAHVLKCRDSCRHTVERDAHHRQTQTIHSTDTSHFHSNWLCC